VPSDRFDESDRSQPAYQKVLERNPGGGVGSGQTCEDVRLPRAVWTDAAGLRQSQTFNYRRLAVAHLVKVIPGGLRFHDLRHSYATWLISDGVPVNDVQQVMGHEQASTTLNRYTHASTMGTPG